MAFGIRYASLGRTPEGEPVHLHLWQMDKPLMFSLVFLTIVAIIGVGIAFVGLAYHHHRRHHQFLRQQARAAGARVAREP